MIPRTFSADVFWRDSGHTEMSKLAQCNAQTICWTSLGTNPARCIQGSTRAPPLDPLSWMNSFHTACLHCQDFTIHCLLWLSFNFNRHLPKWFFFGRKILRLSRLYTYKCLEYHWSKLRSSDHLRLAVFTFNAFLTIQKSQAINRKRLCWLLRCKHLGTCTISMYPT